MTAKKAARVVATAAATLAFACSAAFPAIAADGIIIDEGGNAISENPPVYTQPEPVTEEIVISPAPPTPSPSEPAPTDPGPEAPTDPTPEAPGEGSTPPEADPAPTEPAPAPTPPAPAPGENPTPDDGIDTRNPDAAPITAGAPCLEPGQPIPAELIAKGYTAKDIKWCKVKGKPAPEVVPEIVIDERVQPEPTKVQPLIDTGMAQQVDSPSSVLLVLGMLGLVGAAAVSVVAVRTSSAARTSSEDRELS